MKNVAIIFNVVGDWSADHWGVHRLETTMRLCLYVCVRPVKEVSWGGAVRVQDTQYVADDVSKLSLWTATLSQQESVEIGESEREREREREGGGGAVGARGDTGGIVPLSDSPFSLISSRSSYRKPDGGWKKKSLVSPIPLSRSTPSFILHPF